MSMKIAFVLLIVAVAVKAQCDGSCQDTSESCPVSYKSGLCPGGSNIECCTETTPNCPGQCQDKSLSCAGSYVSGDCPGSSNVLCCKGTQPFGDRQWNCGDVNCDQVVASGSGQPNYQCAEFVSRSLAAGGHIPNIGALASQSEYGSYSYGGKVYDLLWVSDLQGGPLGLRECLMALGWTSVSTSSIKTASAVFVDGSDGAYSHVAIGVGSNLCDAHNNARYHVSCSSYYTVNEVLNPPAYLPSNLTLEQAGPLPEHLRAGLVRPPYPHKERPSN